MKRVLTVLLIVFLLFLAACGGKKGDSKSMISMDAYEELEKEIVRNPVCLATFLEAANVLDEFVDPGENAVTVFIEDENIRQKAIERAKEMMQSK